jgi:hypothetical protein
VSAHNLQQIEASIRSGYYNESVLKFYSLKNVIRLFDHFYFNRSSKVSI